MNAHRPRGGVTTLQKYLAVSVFATVLVALTSYTFSGLDDPYGSVPSKLPPSAINTRPTVTTTVKQLREVQGEDVTGLLVVDDNVYQLVGDWSGSQLIKFDRVTGATNAQAALKKGSGHGLAVIENSLAFMSCCTEELELYDKDTLQPLSKFSLPTTNGRGYGLTTFDGGKLMISDGTHVLSVFDSVTKSRISQHLLLDGSLHVPKITDLEFVNGELWVVVLEENKIAVVTLNRVWKVRAWVDISEISQEQGGGLLTAISYDKKLGSVFLAGNGWGELVAIHAKV